MERVPYDVDEYVRRTQSSPCFICAMVAGEHNPEYIVTMDDENLVWVPLHPTLVGYALVAPRAHRENVVRDLPEDVYLRLMSLVYRVARAVAAIVPTERTYLLSLGSQQGNAHVHWHVASLPPGVPYREQQFYALMAENGVLPWTREQAVELAARLRAALSDMS